MRELEKECLEKRSFSSEYYNKYKLTTPKSLRDTMRPDVLCKIAIYVYSVGAQENN
jgi:hypothetical protein